MTDRTPRVSGDWLGPLLLLPALLGAVWVGSLAQLGGADALPGPDDRAFMQMVASGALGDAHAAIVAGQRTDIRVPYSHPDLSGDEEVLVSPLVLAVAVRGENMVRMLLAWGDAPGPLEPVAACMAHALGRDALGDLIAERRGPFAGACPPWQDGAPPLLAPLDAEGRPLLGAGDRPPAAVGQISALTSR